MTEGELIESEWKGWSTIINRMGLDIERKREFINLLEKDKICCQMIGGQHVILNRNELIKFIEKSSTKENHIQHMKMLSAAIELGSREYGWQCPALMPPGKIKRNIPAFDIDNTEIVICAEKLEDHILNSDNINVKKMSSDAAIGLLILSMIYFSGVLSIRLMLEIIRHIKNPIVRARSVSFIDLDNAPLSLRLTRLILHEISELIFLSINKTAIDRIKPNKKSIYSYIKKYFSETNFNQELRPDNLDELYTWVVEMNLGRYPRDLTDYAQGLLRTTQLKNDAFYRLMRVQHPNKLKKEQKNYEKPVNNLIDTEIHAGSLVYELYDVVNNSHDKNQCFLLLDSLIKKYINSSGHLFNISILAEWIKSIILIENEWKKQKKELLIKIKGVVQLIYGALADKMINEITNDEIVGLYQRILDSIDEPLTRKLIARHCWEFNQFLVHKLGVKRITKETSLFSGYLFKNVDSNIMTFREIKLVQKKLLLESDVELSSIVNDISNIGFFCGPRTSELRDLLVDDLELSNQHIFIREHEGRSLKTHNAKRKLPLTAMMSYENIDSINNRKIKILENSNHDCTIAYLFGSPHENYTKSPNRKKISTLLHKVLRDVSGDDSVRYYTLRHSALSWLMLCLQWPSELPSTWLELDNETQKFLKSGNKILRSLQGLAEIPNIHPQFRQSIIYLYRNQGHGSAQTSYEHYMHFFDILWLANLKSFYGEISDKCISSLTAFQVRTIREAKKNNSYKNLLDNYRKRFSDRITYLPLINELEEVDSKNDFGMKPVSGLYHFIETCMTIVEQHFRHKISYDDLSRRFDLPFEIIFKLIEQFETNNTISFVNKNKLCEETDFFDSTKCMMLKQPRERWQKLLFNQSINLLEKNIIDDPDSLLFIKKIIDDFKWRKNYALFNDEIMSSEYISWLREIGFNLNQIKVIHYHGSGNKSAINGQTKIWRNKLDLPKKMSVKQVRLSKDRKMLPLGRLGILITAEGLDESKKAQLRILDDREHLF